MSMVSEEREESAILNSAILKTGDGRLENKDISKPPPTKLPRIAHYLTDKTTNQYTKTVTHNAYHTTAYTARQPAHRIELNLMTLTD